MKYWLFELQSEGDGGDGGGGDGGWREKERKRNMGP